MRRSELMVGALLGLILGGLVTLGLAHRSASASPKPAPVPTSTPLRLSESMGTEHHLHATEGEHRRVRPSRQRVYAPGAARSRGGPDSEASVLGSAGSGSAGSGSGSAGSGSSSMPSAVVASVT